MSGHAIATADFLARKGAALRALPARTQFEVELLRARAAAAAAPPDFAGAIARGACVAVIAEFKRRSPSAGALTDEKPADVVAGYRTVGATAASVLTDASDFGGSLDDLRAVASDDAALPVLRKDFVLDEAGLLEARAAGAAAVLLIVALLGPTELERLVRSARGIDLQALVEVHNERELDAALMAGASLVGVNNRDLSTLRTDLQTTERLASRMPGGTVVVAESGIRSAAHVGRMRDAGAHAVLVGESLLRLRGRARDTLLRELSTVPR